ncbi:hypothetical protein DFJ73DRAFT_801884 [Zopfochytrium polystomum]|nr:hypothetical protein DFJ73DRAFT_801884 [Zopfochytrium polystomum]
MIGDPPRFAALVPPLERLPPTPESPTTAAVEHAASAPAESDALERRREFRNALIYLAAKTVRHAFLERTASPPTGSSQPMCQFLFTALARSGSSFQELQLAVWYFLRFCASLSQRARLSRVLQAIAEPGSHPETQQSPRLGDPAPLTDAPPHPLPLTAPSNTHPNAAQPSRNPNTPTSDPPTLRIFFLACLILAHKYCRDNSLALSSWSQQSGVPAAVLVAAERCVLKGLGFSLAVDMERLPDGTVPFARFCAVAARAAMELVRAEGGDPDVHSANDASLATVIPPPPEETGRTDSNADNSLPTIRRDFRRALIFVAAATVDGDFSSSPHGPLRERASVATLRFVHDVVRRSQSTFFDLQLAVFYYIRYRLRSNAASPTPTPTTHTAFLACLILAHKFLHDRTICLSWWSARSGVSPRAATAAERAVLIALDHALFVPVGGGGSGGGGVGSSHAAGFEQFCGIAVGTAMRIAGVALAVDGDAGRRTVVVAPAAEENEERGAKRRRGSEVGNDEDEEEGEEVQLMKWKDRRLE